MSSRCENLPCNKSPTSKLQWVVRAEIISQDTAGSVPGWSSKKPSGRICLRIYLSKHIPRVLLDLLVPCWNPAWVSWHFSAPCLGCFKGRWSTWAWKAKSTVLYLSLLVMFHLNLPSKSAYSDLSKPAHPSCHCKSPFPWSRIELARRKLHF